ncbi:hypothetical protein KI811_11950 [Geobacter hydrogenophilus]|uniref:Lipoprotein n=1 Tax=Geobacter hydrogenophilus TaxID=40983 RepID=A0A9W6G2I3_9BACT|nr:hypothetical protein [Geobacter hydrogenophilus]MBT0894522.1 hypothetical protein [Geobacter hydrogenophilus]GLI39321.1 hypothetical protein GHYDROH2_28220 [Geobacter hydrogenophilus]
MKKACWSKVCLIIVAMLAGGCASSKPTIGDTMLLQGETARELSKKWTEGNSLLIEGEELKKKGQKMIEEGKDKIEEADVMISEGKRMMETSEKTFAEKFPNITPLR